LKELAYGAGHEINNPLANISARAQTLLQSESDPDRRRLLAAINTQAFRAHEMIADMMLFARPPKPQLASIDLAVLVGEVVQELSEQAAAVSGVLHYQPPDAAIEITADKTQIGVAIRAVCANALEARPSGARVEIELRQPATSPRLCKLSFAITGREFRRRCDSTFSIPSIPAARRAAAWDSVCRSAGGSCACTAAQSTLALAKSAMPMSALAKPAAPNSRFRCQFATTVDFLQRSRDADR